ncbi:MAG TPA: DUF1080 domain-containing protein [Pedobacter sp.]|jgi:hypothetical protein
MRPALILLTAVLLFSGCASTQLNKHPNSSTWKSLFKEDFSDAIAPTGEVWTFENGVLTASKDENLYSKQQYNDFIIDLEFKTAEGTNSGVIVHVSDTKNWIPNSVEVQIADDFADQWSKAPKNWQSGAVFGHQAATKSNVKKPGEWNRYTVTCKGKMIWVVLNGELVNEFDMSKFTSAKTNPDGSEIPGWLSNPLASLPLRGHIGLQGKHAGAPIYFRNIRIKEL